MTSTINATGHIASDINFDYPASGRPWANARIAVDQGYMDRTTNQWVDQGTDFYSMAAFGPLAEKLYEHFKSGDRVTITGRPMLDTGGKNPSINVMLTSVTSAPLERRPARTAVRDLTNSPNRSDIAADHDAAPVAAEPAVDDSARDQEVARDVEQHEVAIDTPLTPEDDRLARIGDYDGPRDNTEVPSVEYDDDGHAYVVDNRDLGVDDPALAPSIVHGPEGTRITGMTKDDTDLRAIVKEQGFKYAASSKTWYLPSDLGAERRQFKADAVVAAASDSGIYLDQVPADSPSTAAAPTPAAPAAAAPARSLNVVR